MRIERIQTEYSNNVVELKCGIENLGSILEKYQDKKGNLIPILQAIQDLYGFIPQNALEEVHHKLGLNLNDMYGVATFYAQFRLAPVGKYIIKMCHGTACHVQNVSAVTEELMSYLDIKDGETTPDKLFTLETVACLGCCSLAPVMMIGNDTYGKLSPQEAVKVIRNIKKNEL